MFSKTAREYLADEYEATGFDQIAIDIRKGINVLPGDARAIKALERVLQDRERAREDATILTLEWFENAFKERSERCKNYLGGYTTFGQHMLWASEYVKNIKDYYIRELRNIDNENRLSGTRPDQKSGNPNA